MKNRLAKVPLQPGVYLYKNKEGQVIYVGKARLLRNRMRSYFQSPTGMHPKVKAMMARVADFDYIVTASEVEALILENNLIKAYQPRYNIHLRDDKTYPYLKISNEKFPRLAIVREEKDGQSRYFGPYTEVGSLRETIKLMTLIFPLRTCRNFRFNHRPCLNFDLGKCLAPCSGKVELEAYQEIVLHMIDFLEGNTQSLVTKITEEMKAAAADLQFEKAARLRDQLQAIKVLREKQKVHLEHPYQLDIISMTGEEHERLILLFKLRAGKIVGKETFWLKRAIDEDDSEALAFFLKRYYAESTDVPQEILVSYPPAEKELLEKWLKSQVGATVKIRTPQRGDKHQLLQMVTDNARLLWQERHQQDMRQRAILGALAQELNLEVVPLRIEGYDISHLSGEQVVASMVVATAGEIDKKAYRRFKIKSDRNNDVANLSETVERRFKEARQGNPAFLPEPDLLLIDGGLGQVNAVKMTLDSLGVDIPVVGLAKKNEELFRPGVSDPLVLPRRHEGLRLLQHLRDEAHRFALAYNRQRRNQKTRQSVLDEIPGIGSKRKQSLLAHFGSTAKIREATREELSQVPGMNRPAAATVFEFFHPAAPS